MSVQADFLTKLYEQIDAFEISSGWPINAPNKPPVAKDVNHIRVSINPVSNDPVGVEATTIRHEWIVQLSIYVIQGEGNIESGRALDAIMEAFKVTKIIQGSVYDYKQVTHPRQYPALESEWFIVPVQFMYECIEDITPEAPTGRDIVYVPTSYVRPDDWLEMPTVIDGDQKVALLVGIHDTEATHMAIQVSGDYTVDWGDSTTDDFTSDSLATHSFSWDDFDDTTLTTDGFRQSIVTITPRGGDNLTSVALSPAHPLSNANARSPILQCVVAGEFITFCKFNGSGKSSVMESFEWIGDCNLTSGSYMFYVCNSLVSVKGIDCRKMATGRQMFSECRSLREVPDHLDFAVATSIDRLFNSASAMKYAPRITAPLATNASSLFANNYGVLTHHDLDLPLVTNLSRAFSGNRSLLKAPAVNAPLCTDYSQMYRYNYALRSVTAMAVNSGSNIDLIFTSTYSLTEIDLTGIDQTIDISGNSMSAVALNTVFTNLASGVTGQTITVTGNPGALTCDPTIATVKGWIVVTA